MNKLELIDKTAKEARVTKKTAREVLEAALMIVKETLEEHEEVKITGFGKFTVRHAEARKGHNPATGKLIDLPARDYIRFKPFIELRKGVEE